MFPIFLYNGSWKGLLSCIQEIFEKDMPDCEIRKSESGKAYLFGNPILLKTDEKKITKLKETVCLKMGENTLRILYYAFLSEDPAIENTILHYIKLGFSLGKKIHNMLQNDYVNRIETMSKKVIREKHRYLGLLRFEELPNHVLYAQFEPDYFVLPLLAKPFFDRLGSEDFIIFDQRRKKAIIKERTEFYFQVLDEEMVQELRDSSKDQTYETLWITYFKTVAITLRKNLKLQRNKVPLKCVPYLTEGTAIQEEYGFEEN